MGSVIAGIQWVEKSADLEQWLDSDTALTVQDMKCGLEAEVMKLITGKDSYVLKVWNKSSRPDVRCQFHLLKLLLEQGITVSRPLGWGSNADGHRVLLTSFDGNPMKKLTAGKVTALARLLASIHQVPVDECDYPPIPEYDFRDYFFQGVQDHPDLMQALNSILSETPIRQDSLIHGDFHLGNIVEDHSRYAVIDWTNGQLGDFRYDFAWSLALLKIYISGRYAGVFQSAYLLEQEMVPEELERYEALACLRWVALHRSGGVPVESNTISRVQSLIRNNRWLNGRVKA